MILRCLGQHCRAEVLVLPKRTLFYEGATAAAPHGKYVEAGKHTTLQPEIAAGFSSDFGLPCRQKLGVKKLGSKL